MFRKPWNANKNGALDLIMEEYDDIRVDAIEEIIEEDNETTEMVETENE
jgi:hypothetical protein